MKLWTTNTFMWVGRGAGLLCYGCVSIFRKLHEEDSSETSSPPKRVSLHVTCQSFSKIKVNDDESKPSTAQPTPSCPDPPRRIIKVKRPAKRDGSTGEGEKIARTAGWTTGGSGKTSSGAVNGKVCYHVIRQPVPSCDTAASAIM